MKTYTSKNITGTGEGTVYVLETLADWDTYEEILGGRDKVVEYDRNFYEFKKDFEKYIGREWTDNSFIAYAVVGMEDNNPAMDWYWVLQNVQDEKDIKYLLVNSWELEKGLVNVL